MCGLWSEHWQADPPPLQPLQQCWQHSYVYFPNTNSGYDAEHVHSTSLVDHGEVCSECNLSCKTDVWSWPLYCSSVSGSWQSSYSLCHLYVEQQLFFSDTQRVLYHEVSCWTSSVQYERVRAITPNLTRLLPIHTWDLVTLTSHMTPGRENSPIWKFSLRGVLTFVASDLDINGCVLSYFEGTANVHCYTSCTLTTLHCSKVSFLQYCQMKRYNKIFTKMWGVYSLLWDTVNWKWFLVT